MPAWIAGIQVAGCSGDIHVNLDFSTPWWNDPTCAIAKFSQDLPEHEFWRCVIIIEC